MCSAHVFSQPLSKDKYICVAADVQSSVLYVHQPVHVSSVYIAVPLICTCRIPYYAMTQVSFGSTFFGLQYHCRNDDGTSTDKRLRIMVRNKYIARHIFRETTEQQVFFYQATVLPEVRNHTDTRSRRFRMLFKRATCRAGAEDKEYYFDILRTKHEVYSHVWQVLHQVQGSGERGAGGGQGEGTGAESPYATVTM